jgi:hypothetical protein
MKIHPESREIDLVVDTRPLTEKEYKELDKFMEQVRLRDKVKKKKHPHHKKAA